MQAVDKIAFRQGRVASVKRPVRPAPQAPVRRELGEGLREIADPELRACLESLAAQARRITTARRAVDRVPSTPIPIIRSNDLTMNLDPVLVPALPSSRTACNADKTATMAPAAHRRHRRAGAAPPNNGDWSTVVAKTPEGGFLMGNPDAKVKLVEFGSLTCPHCADFDEQGGEAADRQLRQERPGQLRVPQLRARSARHHRRAARALRRRGELLRPDPRFFADQQDWIGKIQAADPAQMQALESQPPQAAVQGASPTSPASSIRRDARRAQAKTEACLADPAAATSWSR